MANELDKIKVDLNEKLEIFLAEHEANISHCGVMIESSKLKSCL